jgi:pimeloyl-ACP methyl ester carboxylesterase
MSTRLRRVTVLGHEVRVSVRPGTGPGPPLVICNGIGASLDLLEPFVDALDPRIEVVTFDVPGAGAHPSRGCPTTSRCSRASSSGYWTGSATTSSTSSASPGAAAWRNRSRSSTAGAAADWSW